LTTSAYAETEKLINDKNALKSYIVQYATNQGLKDLSGKEPELQKVPEQVPTEGDIKKEREDIAGTVKQEQQKAGEEIGKGKEKIKSFNVPTVKLPKIEAPELKLQFFNKGEVPPKYNDYLEWLNEQKKKRDLVGKMTTTSLNPFGTPVIRDTFDLKK
jgi:hypothetical protein